MALRRMAALRGVSLSSSPHSAASVLRADSALYVPVGSITSTFCCQSHFNWSTFSWRVMRGSRSATRSGMGRVAFLYLGGPDGLEAWSGPDGPWAETPAMHEKLRMRTAKRRTDARRKAVFMARAEMPAILSRDQVNHFSPRPEPP